MKNLFCKKAQTFIYYILLVVILCFGIYLRIRLYLNADPLWWDEMVLSFNIHKMSFINLFSQLDNLQVCPPIYLVVIKCITKIFHNGNVLALRFVSMAAGCSALIIFPLLVRKIFNSKIASLAAIFLFAINEALIYYSKELKPYSSDVFICILLLCLYDKIDVKNKWYFFLYSVIVFLLPLCSFPSIIIIGAILCLKFLSTKKSDRIKYFLLCIPLMLSSGLIWFINKGQYSGQLASDDWFNCFFSLSFQSFIHIISEYLKWLKYDSVIALICLFAGMFYFICKKNKVCKLMLLIFVFCCIASFLHMWPFNGRTILFLTPLFIIFMTVPIDNDENGKLLSIVKSFVILFVLFISINIQTNFFNVQDSNYSFRQGTKHDRENITNEVLNLLEAYNDGEKLIAKYEFFTYIDYYNLVYNYNKQINLVSLDMDFDKLEEEISNNPNDKYWIFLGHEYWPALVNIDDKHETLEKILDKLNIKYDVWHNVYSSTYHIINK